MITWMEIKQLINTNGGKATKSQAAAHVNGRTASEKAKANKRLKGIKTVD